MEQYANLSGKSGIAEYEIQSDYIIIVFNNGDIKTYNKSEDGYDDLEEIKFLATSGSGLNTFLNTL